MTSLGRRNLLLGATTGAALTLTSRASAIAAPGLLLSDRPSLTHGIQSGDVRAFDATLWSRADRPSRLVAEISRDPGFTRVRRVAGPVVRPTTDLTGELRVGGLAPGRDWFYRVRAVDLHDPRRTSEWSAGHLRTAPLDRRDLRFLWSGDIAGQGWGVNPDLGGFPIADAMRARGADFFLSSGDNVYADGPVQPSVTLPDGRVWRNIVVPEKTKVAETLAEFRGQYKYNLLADNWRAFLAETPIVAQWDDHEVTNNWYPGEVLTDPRYTEQRVDVLVARASQAFHEFIPVGKASPDRDGRIYRKLSYGPQMDLFILDMRTHKDANTANAETEADGGVLGERQTAWLLRELASSKATWKVIAADMPIGLVIPDGPLQEGLAQGDPGRPLGRELDIARVLTGLKRLGIRNHVWLTADVHYTAAHHYSPDRAAYQDFDPFWEFVSGPLNAGGFGPNRLDATFGPRAEFVAAPSRANTSPLEGFQYFGEVEINGATSQLTVTLRGLDGSGLWTKTLDPEVR